MKGKDGLLGLNSRSFLSRRCCCVVSTPLLPPLSQSYFTTSLDELFFAKGAVNILVIAALGRGATRKGLRWVWGELSWKGKQRSWLTCSCDVNKRPEGVVRGRGSWDERPRRPRAAQLRRKQLSDPIRAVPSRTNGEVSTQRRTVLCTWTKDKDSADMIHSVQT